MDKALQQKIADLIRYHPENEGLDFKKECHRKEKNAELLKDIMSFANAEMPGEKYIIFGVKKHTNSFEIFPIDTETDEAALQQLIMANLTPDIPVAYETMLFDDKLIAVLRIKNTVDKPYMASKNTSDGKSGSLRTGEMWIRKGSHKMILTRYDLDKIYAEKYGKSRLEGKISVQFENGSQYCEFPCVREVMFPSDVERIKIAEQIRFKESLSGPRFLEYIDKAEPNSYGSMAIPKLRQLFADAEMHFREEDRHYLYETRAVMLNLQVINRGDQYLEDALIEIRIPVTESLFISDHIWSRGMQYSGLDAHLPKAKYPSVKEENNYFVITESIGNVRHNVPSPAFFTAIRMTPGESLSGISVMVTATVHGSNLSQAQSNTLEIKFV
ncbi:ATP-binding protein [Mucilaginibacter sp. HMF5004]|uniref:AlbA family DNA-binding domain-containing protein n=1 Tax=Mucilaginibacter rivuli TaxID=2857527 RepID=UPI001C5F21B3|nr:ATP-binding protein [Mucilaginibacter rivuli]MBW4888905.1 ATP-binding protein [Mucilaginibacter rivuli]